MTKNGYSNEWDITGWAEDDTVELWLFKLLKATASIWNTNAEKDLRIRLK